MDMNVWTAETVVTAVTQGNPNLEVVVSNYFKAFIERLAYFQINLQSVSTAEELNQKVLEGIAQLEIQRKEVLSVIEMFALSNHPCLETCLPAFFRNLITFYEEYGINLYSGTSADVLRNDHYRFFNQYLFISVASVLLENQCFEALRLIVQDKYKVFNQSYGLARDMNFIRFRAYNYTLNQFMNTGSPQRISVTADYIDSFSGPVTFEKLIRADILLYYLSLWNHTNDVLDAYWFPELSVYNRSKDILPYMVSKTYFEKAKVLFGVDTVEQYRQLLVSTPDTLERNGLYRVPMLPVGLMNDTVGSEA